ncbi:polysaccharide biosynthesis protein [Nocardia sp. MDA0666]|uniref:polysaccharide biosynthesis protein n=1 Tax=Nocardia sp. MDA0666 TaxID=2135448 RepID=UPI000D127E54|nr:polysaccharide biosynthesis protein [Nocardia sp. MDA0666]PSR67931.1 polysaccharide biosynthesis protein [Nocardia sp. MDA0666]
MPALRRLPVVADMTLVTAGAMTANIAGYLLQLLAGRWLGVAGYSAFASLLAVQLLAAVPALALQNVVARELVRGAAVATVRGLTRRCAMIVAVVAVALIPAVAVLLHVSAVAAGGALIAAPVLVLLSGEQGILQGTNRFRSLATVLGGSAIARVAPALIALAIGVGAAAALWGAALGLLVATTAANRISRIAHSAPDAGSNPLPPNATEGARAPAEVRSAGARIGAARAADVTAVLRAAQVQAALMALSSADLIIARIVLDEADASRYALGAIATKIAFWLPQAVGVVLYPRMAQPQHSVRALRSALGVLAAVGVVAVAGAAVLAPLAPLFAGRDYAPIQDLLWLFALAGALLAVLQGALLSAIAADRTAPAAVIWAGLAVEVGAAVPFVRSLPALIALATAIVAIVTTLVVTVVVRTVRRDPGATNIAVGEKRSPLPTE